MPRHIPLDALDFAEFVRPGDGVIWGQVAGEPLPLSSRLMEQRSSIGGRFSIFLGASFSDTVQPDHADHIDMRAIGGIAGNRRLAKAGVLDVIPTHISAVADYIRDRRIPGDVAMVQLSPPDADGRYSYSVASDYIVAAVENARVVIGEVNASAPRTSGPHRIDPERLACIVETDRPVLAVPPGRIGDAERRIAELAAELIPDRAVLQVGIGAVPDAILTLLGNHKDLGVHSGMIGDGVIDLIERGVVTNAYKLFDRGVSVTGTMAGTERLYRFAHDNPAIEMRSTDHTHGAAVLAAIPGLVSINSAIEVDLTGQVNAEEAAGMHIGAVGGAVDYVRGAHKARGGRSMIALSATAGDGKISKVVSRLGGAVSTARSDVDVIITEFGVAELRAKSLRERARAMIAIAHPDFREQLAADARAMFGA
ncbi:acetyl-CoA hydrolase/transferase C-terminal domain-containing protein [Sphingomonas sp. AOB5]|uniref:acetyl-CoA hydrolase/transferase family protein n=1 Tax=Sphingomonas sp. AOB5 TaxID=3034017 RepID=UPI0023F77474|nr:acetyl-CoA hydrolase/transferase C-terminal domain-containing protein [Sphingomonas sp. AOB5]MDF7774827.1 acetyl-CoA hydrolase/transferase C-terminal domain-containing protein [Sphingomonas sp. AOB5]